MGKTFDLINVDTKEKLWVGQQSIGGRAYLYTEEHGLLEFLMKSQGQHIVFMESEAGSNLYPDCHGFVDVVAEKNDEGRVIGFVPDPDND